MWVVSAFGHAWVVGTVWWCGFLVQYCWCGSSVLLLVWLVSQFVDVSCPCCFIFVDSFLWGCWCGSSVVFNCHCVVSLHNIDTVFVM